MGIERDLIQLNTTKDDGEIMDVRNTGSWDDHNDYYSDQDLCFFAYLLPTLVSDSFRNTDFAKKERKEMMERFMKEFGVAPLKIGGNK